MDALRQGADEYLTYEYMARLDPIIQRAMKHKELALWATQQNLVIQCRLSESNTLAEGLALSENERVGTDKVLQLIVNSARELIQHAEE